MLKSIQHLENRQQGRENLFSFFLSASLLASILFLVYVTFFSFKGTSHFSLGDGIFITIVGGLGMIAPAPGGLGAYHAAVIAGLTALNIDGSLARSFAVVIHSSQTVMMVTGGLVALIMLSLGRKRQRKS